jgi:hypothetical protein
LFIECLARQQSIGERIEFLPVFAQEAASFGVAISNDLSASIVRAVSSLKGFVPPNPAAPPKY